MSRNKYKNLTFIILGFCFVSKCHLALARDDWESWSALNFSKVINKKISLNISMTSRIRDDMSEMYFGGIQVGPEFEINSCYSISPSYFWIKNKNGDGFKPEHRWMLDNIFKFKTHIFSFNNRFRIEYRDLPSLDRFRYRYRLKANIPTKFGKHKIAPYLSNEVFYEERKNDFNQNRFSAGIVINLKENVKFDVYYLLRSDKSGEDWISRNVLGTSLSCIF